MLPLLSLEFTFVRCRRLVCVCLTSPLRRRSDVRRMLHQLRQGNIEALSGGKNKGKDKKSKKDKKKDVDLSRGRWFMRSCCFL